MSTRDVMLQALDLARTNLDNYKQVEKEWHMTEEVKPKRPRGNPNFVKKSKPESDGVALLAKVPETTYTYEYRYAESEAEVWLRLYAAVIGTYSTNGPAIIAQAATGADLALAQYKTRYPK